MNQDIKEVTDQVEDLKIEIEMNAGAFGSPARSKKPMTTKNESKPMPTM